MTTQRVSPIKTIHRNGTNVIQPQPPQLWYIIVDHLLDATALPPSFTDGLSRIGTIGPLFSSEVVTFVDFRRRPRDRNSLNSTASVACCESERAAIVVSQVEIKS